MIKILLACINADFGQNGQLNTDLSNASWERMNIYPALKRLENEGLIQLETHWLDQQNNPQGFDRLLTLSKNVDLIFQVAVSYQLSIHHPYCKQIIDSGTPIVDFLPDPYARYDRYWPQENWVIGRFREKYVTHYLSSAKHMVSIMESDGLPVQYMPFGIPNYSFRIEDDYPKLYDCSLVAQNHGIRKQIVQQLQNAGINVHLWGHYWDDMPNWHGRPSYKEMNLIFNQSKVNLNLRWCSRDANKAQIKGRDLELLGAGAFMLATKHPETDDFHELYTPCNDFVETITDLANVVKYYIDSNDEREQIANNALSLRKRERNLWTTRFKTFIDEWPLWKDTVKII